MTRIAVVGAGGCVGQTMIELLEQDSTFDAQPVLYGSSRTRGEEISFRGETIRSRVLWEDRERPFEVALFAVEGDVAKEWAPKLAGDGVLVVDNSSAFRLDPEIPLVIPEINGELLQGYRSRRGGIIANPNCSTIILLLAIHPLLQLGRFRVVVSTYQAVSGAGKEGMEALERESSGGRFEKNRPFPFPIRGNLFPLIGSISPQTGLSGEEQKIIDESRKILSLPELEVHATCVRVPVERCHSESVTLLFDDEVDLGAARECLRAAPGLLFVDDAEDPPTPQAIAREELVRVGRLRRPSPRVLQLWVVGDQLLKGAALNAVQIARAVVAGVVTPGP